MSLIDTREISKVKIMMVGGGGGSDAATLAGIGKKVSVSGKTVTTDIDLFRAPKEGDRLLVFFDDLVDDPETMIVYNDGTPVSISLVGEMIPLDYYLNGLCVFQLKTNFITSTPYWDLIERSEGVSYTAGTGIEITNGTIRNILPQLGDNSQLKSVDSVTQGRLGSYSGDVKYLLIHFDTDAEPYSGAYSLMLSYSGSVAVMKYATLYDRVMGMEYDREIYSGSTLLCEIMDEGTGTQADPVHVDVLGTIDGYVTAGWGRQAALGERATAEGIGTEASGNYAHAQGSQTTASGNLSTAMGYSTTASADGATAMGNGSRASGVNSIAGGYNTQASGAVSTAIGTNTQATQQAQLAAGKYNKTNNDAIVMVGNGTGASARSNALEVLLNGDVVAGNEIIDGQGNTLSVLAEALTKTASGNPVVISDCAGGKARSLITEIEPIQDLHGYDKPWVGGAGKNKWPFGDFIGTYSNVPFTLAAGTYTVSKANHDVNCGLRFFYADDTSIAFTFFTSETFTLTADVVKINYSSADATTENFMLESGSTATSYAPYSNICPISGRTAAVLTRSKYGMSFVQGGLQDNTGAEVESNSRIRTDYIPFTDSSFTLSMENGENDDVLRNSIYLYDAQKHFIATKQYGLNPSTFPVNVNIDIPTNTAYMRFVVQKSDATANISPSNRVMTVNSTNFTIQLGQTVYGADINWDTGVGTVKTALVTLNGTEDWNVETTTQSGVYRYSLANGIDNIKLPVNNNTPLECNSNMYVGITANESYVASKYGISNLSLNSNKLVVIDETYHANDATAWKAYLANNPLQIEYELANKPTIQLTPEQLTMLKGYNRVTIDNGSIEVGYIAKLT